MLPLHLRWAWKSRGGSGVGEVLASNMARYVVFGPFWPHAWHYPLFPHHLGALLRLLLRSPWLPLPPSAAGMESVDNAWPRLGSGEGCHWSGNFLNFGSFVAGNSQNSPPTTSKNPRLVTASLNGDKIRADALHKRKSKEIAAIRIFLQINNFYSNHAMILLFVK